MSKVATAFFGSSNFSLPYLESLLRNPLIELTLIISQPDRPSGRGFETQPTATKTWAQKNEILVLTPTLLSESLFLGALKTLPLQLGLTAYYGLKIPKAVIDRFPLGILNIHHSLLPKHRGASPIPWTILAGEQTTGTSIIEIDENFDRGGMIAKAEETVGPADTTGRLRARLDEKALNLLEEVLPKYLRGEIEPQKTVRELGSFEPKITKGMAKIDWRKSDVEIERTIRAFDPWPGAWTTLDELASRFEIQDSRFKTKNKRVKILKAHLNEGKELIIESLQIEGKKPIGWGEFLAGYAKTS